MVKFFYFETIDFVAKQRFHDTKNDKNSCRENTVLRHSRLAQTKTFKENATICDNIY